MPPEASFALTIQCAETLSVESNVPGPTVTYNDKRSNHVQEFTGFGRAFEYTMKVAMKLRTAQGKLKIEHSIIDGLRPVLERLLRDCSEIRSVIPGVIRVRSILTSNNSARSINTLAGLFAEVLDTSGFDPQ